MPLTTARLLSEQDEAPVAMDRGGVSEVLPMLVIGLLLDPAPGTAPDDVASTFVVNENGYAER